ncbi:GspE/PulE family protein [Iamia majanohamensis]|uniref:GspE/PulE family protein n=1 Tax=Iamia majanohamensis TaxID=467976 RepID=A0AAE9Y5I6_9ACTN|nr:GspE/PulE family protein [Iamia majanohamensis]WCO66840.1 GspE/PulE family protein [Iamia majanohamensis]
MPSTGEAPEAAPSAPGAPATAEVADHRPLGQILVDLGAVDADAVEAALAEQAGQSAADRQRIGHLLVDRGHIDQPTLATALATQFGLATVNLTRSSPDTSLLAMLTREVAEDLDALPLRREGAAVVVAVADPTLPDLAAILSQTVGAEVVLAVSPPGELARARAKAYEATEGLGDIIRAFEARAGAPAQEETTTVQVDANAPVVQVITRIIETAVVERASDVHIEPMEDRVRVRNRIDGALKEVLSLPTSMSQALSSRVKIMAGLNIVERRRPQDGQIETVAAGRPLDIRVSTAGTMFGESVVLRILDKQRALYGLHDLGMPEDVEKEYREVIHSPYGLVVCAGPTGSGKTTTLYSTLQTVKSDEINVMTVEDPVEYVFPDINQMSINETAGLTFASGLRAILRQDPDSILVGEIRDAETARIAIQAALTGHFVLSTVHATDAARAMHRFIDMGIEPFLLASSVLATVGQRLVRTTCTSCAQSYRPTPEEMDFYERAGGTRADDDVFRRGAGCDACNGTGYYGRIGVYEVLRMTDAIRELVIGRAQTEEIRRTAIDEGMSPMQERAVGLIDEGGTTVAEVMRTVYVV